MQGDTHVRRYTETHVDIEADIKKLPACLGTAASLRKRWHEKKKEKRRPPSPPSIRQNPNQRSQQTTENWAADCVLMRTKPVHPRLRARTLIVSQPPGRSSLLASYITYMVNPRWSGISVFFGTGRYKSSGA